MPDTTWWHEINLIRFLNNISKFALPFPADLDNLFSQGNVRQLLSFPWFYAQILLSTNKPEVNRRYQQCIFTFSSKYTVIFDKIQRDKIHHWFFKPAIERLLELSPPQPEHLSVLSDLGGLLGMQWLIHLWITSRLPSFWIWIGFILRFVKCLRPKE